MDLFHKDILKFGGLTGLRYFQFYLRGREEMLVSLFLTNPETGEDIIETYLITMYYKKGFPIIYLIQQPEAEADGTKHEEQTEFGIPSTAQWKRKQVRLRTILEELLGLRASAFKMTITNPFAVDRPYFATLCENPELLARAFPRCAQVIQYPEQTSMLAAIVSGTLLRIIGEILVLCPPYAPQVYDDLAYNEELKEDGLPFTYLDSIFSCFSCVTGTGFFTIDSFRCTQESQVLILLMMAISSPLLLSLIPVTIRRVQLQRNLKYHRRRIWVSATNATGFDDRIFYDGDRSHPDGLPVQFLDPNRAVRRRRTHLCCSRCRRANRMNSRTEHSRDETYIYSGHVENSSTIEIPQNETITVDSEQADERSKLLESMTTSISSPIPIFEPSVSSTERALSREFLICDEPLYKSVNEYLAMGLLIKVIFVYVIVFSLLGFSWIMIFIYTTPNIRNYLAQHLVSPVWFALEVSVSCFHNSGISPIPEGFSRFRQFPQFTICLIILNIAGNTFYPVFLHIIVSILEHFSNVNRPILHFLKTRSRHCYTHLFDPIETRSLAIFQSLFFLIVALPVLIFDYNGMMEGMYEFDDWKPGFFSRFFLAICISTNLRTCGEHFVDLNELNYATLFIFFVAMFLGPYPFIHALRNTEQEIGADSGENISSKEAEARKKTKRKERMQRGFLDQPQAPPSITDDDYYMQQLQIQAPELTRRERQDEMSERTSLLHTGINDGDSGSGVLVRTGRMGQNENWRQSRLLPPLPPQPTTSVRGSFTTKWRESLRFIPRIVLLQQNNATARDILWMLSSIVVICAIETQTIRKGIVTPFDIFFDVGSAYSNVGITMGFAGKPQKKNVPMKTASMIVILVMMFLGKHREIPSSLDKSIDFRHFDRIPIPFTHILSSQDKVNQVLYHRHRSCRKRKLHRTTQNSSFSEGSPRV
ncbi:K+ Transporter [Blattamonas nauphoetae]|uniref:K+ Transporter n=1 Tax=Blattamonas nauphoetae TaxID=2049346 RepID=A0ABQ9Y7G1_9EUKA|nr:K+ Transporter [Blattamonas nauphoetae]